MVHASCNNHKSLPCHPRINGTCSWTCWGNTSRDTWIEVKFDRPLAVGGIITQGNSFRDEWVTRYMVDWEPLVEEVGTTMTTYDTTTILVRSNLLENIIVLNLHTITFY